MSFTEVFGGNVIYPSGQSYLGLTFSTDQQLQWPIEQQVAGNVVASIMDLNATAAGLNVDIPDARQVSNGIQSVFNNVGANTVTIRDAAGGTILSIGVGEAWVAYIADNSTLAGSWRIFQLGASVSVANASALAGAGLKAIATTLNQRIAPTSTAVTPISWVDSDRAQLTVWTGGVGVLNLPAPATVGSDWFSMIRNGGSGDLTLTPPAGLIDTLATLGLSPGESAIVITDGADFFTVGLGQSTSGVFDFIEINVAGSGDFTLSGAQLNRISYRFIGALTGNRNIVVPSSVQQYWVDNSTTGAFSLFVNTVGQVTPIEVQQGDRNITYCDGNEVLQAESATVGFPINIAQGGTSAITAAIALANLGGVAATRLLNTNALSGLTGGGDLSADRSLVLDTDNLTTELSIDLLADTFPFYDDSAVEMRKAPLTSLIPQSIPQTAVQLANEVKTNDIVPTLSNTLFFNLILGARYRFEFYIRYSAAASGPGGIRFNFSGGTTGIGQSFYQYQWTAGLSNSGSIPITLTNFFAEQVADTNLDGGVRHLWGNGVVFATTGGTFGFTWAQQLSSAVNLTVGVPSNMVLTRLS